MLGACMKYSHVGALRRDIPKSHKRKENLVNLAMVEAVEQYSTSALQDTFYLCPL